MKRSSVPHDHGMSCAYWAEPEQKPLSQGEQTPSSRCTSSSVMLMEGPQPLFPGRCRRCAQFPAGDLPKAPEIAAPFSIPFKEGSL